MLTLLTTTENLSKIWEDIRSVDRLEELLTVVTDIHLWDEKNKLLLFENNQLRAPLDWHDTELPYIFPPIEYSKARFLALVFYKLGNPQSAIQQLDKADVLYPHLQLAIHLQFQSPIPQEVLPFVKKQTLHNQCIVQHYGHLPQHKSPESLVALYEKAIAKAENDTLRIFTLKQYGNLLLDLQQYAVLEKLLRKHNALATSETATNALDVLLARVLMEQLTIPYPTTVLKEIMALQEKSIAYYESKGLTVNAALVLIDASEVANFQKDYVLSKTYINKAILYFKEAEIPEFLGEAGLRKATLLYTWSKDGSPQYYKPAINAFQDVLKIFKRDSHPKQFADIHHHLALIYSEIPVAPDEKPLWTAFCASSFKEVLNFYTQEKYPYEFAQVCHNYATALMNFPEAKLHNNLDKAFDLFEAALQIRTKKDYPLERALSLLNQLELYWLMHNEDETAEQSKFKQMIEKANAVADLVSDSQLIQQAEQHLEQLEHLKTLIH